MEATGRRQQWRTHLPEFKHSRRFPAAPAKHDEGGERDRGRDGGQPHKSVVMAPKSRYLTDRRYVRRKPLFPTEPCTTTLKTAYPLEQAPAFQENQLDVSRREEHQQTPDVSFTTPGRESLTPESFLLSCSDVSSPSATRGQLCSPSELRAGPYSQSLSSSARAWAQQGLSNLILEVQRLNPPTRPRLTSPVLHPTYTPRCGYPRTGQTQLRQGGQSSGGRSPVFSMSSHQANYWACAIPKGLPPSPDRCSSSWDPNGEYQALLDYTYPLRPGQVGSEWEPPTDPNVQDSGIGLDHLCCSTSLSESGFTISSTQQSGERGVPTVGQRPPDLRRFTASSEGLASSTPLFQTEPVGLSWDSLDRRTRGFLSSSLSSAVMHSTSVLPRSSGGGGELDEEFRPLPEQLEKLQLLSRQVREATAQLGQPLSASWESLGPGTASFFSSIALLEKQEDEAKGENEAKEPEGSSHDPDETGRAEMSAAQMAATCRDSEPERRRSGAWVEPAGSGTHRSGLEEVEDLAERLCGLALPGGQKSSQENQDQSASLMHHIQVFSSLLEQLIQQLYTALEKMERLAAPPVDAGSMTSPAACQVEVSSRQPLAASVLHTGQLLFSCISATSPLLRDTLLLIERQSRAPETGTGHAFSVPSAVGGLTWLKPVQRSGEEVPGPTGVQASPL